MTIIDLLIVLAFAFYAISSGFRSRRASSRGLVEYFLAGRTLKGWQAGFSMAATQFAADTPLLVMGLIATAGIFSLWRLWIYGVAFLFMGFLLSPCWRRAGVLTDAELTEIRYGGPAGEALRVIKAIYFGTIFNCTVLAMVLLAATRLAEPFLHWGTWLPAPLFDPVVLILETWNFPLTLSPHEGRELWVQSAENALSLGTLVAFTLLYSTTGGLRSVVATDVVQFCLAMTATAIFSWVVVRAAGGMTTILARLGELFTDGRPAGIRASEILAFTPSRAKDASWYLLLAIGLQWLVQMNADGTGYLAQRSMACRSDRDAKEAAVIFTVSQILIRSLLWLPLGLGLLVLFPPDVTIPLGTQVAEREFTYIRGIAELLPSGLRGLMLAGMLAAFSSTLDTHFNWGASYWTNDLYGALLCRRWLRREPSPRSLIWVARGANFLVLAIALGILPFLSSIQTAWQLSLLLGAGMGVMLVLRWLWWRVTVWGELASLASSLLLAPLLLWHISADKEALRLLIMAVGSTSAGLAASLWGPRGDPEVLERFYRRVQPPGFWEPVARGLGEPPGAAFFRLRRGLLAAFTGAFSLFCLLTGLGSWLVQSPPPTWFPSRGIWIGLLVVVGLGLIPLWWRWGFGPGAPDNETTPFKGR